MTSNLPFYNVQVDSRFRDVQAYPNPTDFAVSFKSPSNTGTYVQGVPINSSTGSTDSGFFSPLQIDPDFDGNEFKVVNGTIQNMKAIDANNIVACGLIYDTPFSIFQNSTPLVTIGNEASPNTYPLFLVRMSKNINQWTINWLIYVDQFSSVESTPDNVTRTTFKIDSQNNIFFAFDFTVSQFALRIITPAEISSQGLLAQGTTIFNVENPTTNLACIGIFSFDQNGNLNYVNGHPWGYHILSSNSNMTPTAENGRFNLETDTALSLYVSANTNPYKPFVYKTINSQASESISYRSSSPLVTFKASSGANYGVFITSPFDNITPGCRFNIYNLDTTPPLLINTFNLTTAFAPDIGPVNPAFDLKPIDFTTGPGSGKIFFIIFPGNLSPTSFFYSYIISLDISTLTYTLEIDVTDNWYLHPVGGFGCEAIRANDGLRATDYIYIFTINYGIIPSLSTISIYKYDQATPGVVPSVVKTISYPDFDPWNFPVNLFNTYYGSASINYINPSDSVKYIYYGLVPNSSLNSTSTDPYAKGNKATLIRYDPITNTFKSKIYDSFFQNELEFFEKDTKLYLVQSCFDSGLYEVDPEVDTEPTLVGDLSRGSIYSKTFVVNGSYFVIFNIDLQGIVYNVDDVTKPYVVNTDTRYPFVTDGFLASVNYVSPGTNGPAYAYGFLLDSSIPYINTWFFKCEWLTNSVNVESRHYNSNTESYLSIPYNNIFAIDTISLNFPSVTPNTLLFNPLTNLGSDLLSWYDASNSSSFVTSGNKIQAWLDISGNKINLTQINTDSSPLLINNAVVFDGALEQFIDGSTSADRTIKYMIAVYKINNKNTLQVENIAGWYKGNPAINPSPVFGIAASNFNNTTTSYNFLQNTTGNYPYEQYTYTINNENDVAISDFGFNEDNVGLFLDGVSLNFDKDTPKEVNNLNTGFQFNLGGKRNNFLNWRCIASSSNGNIVYACVENGYIYSSIDYGVSWSQQTQSGNRAWRSLCCSVDGSVVIAAVYGGYIYVSIDSGVTWSEQVLSGIRNWVSISCSSDGSKITAAVESGYVYTSSDTGFTWSSSINSGIRNWSSIDCSTDGLFIVATVNPGFVYTSINQGSTWIERNSLGSKDWTGVTVSADGNVITAIANYIYTSNDRGTTWFNGDSNIVTRVACNYDTSRIAVALANSYIYTSNDGGDNWKRQINSGVRNWSSITVEYFSNFIAATVANGYIYTSTDFGTNWSELTAAGSRNWSCITSNLSTNVILAAAEYGGYIYTSTDSGVTWSTRLLSGSRNWSSITNVINTSNVLYLAASEQNGYIYTSLDGGLNWVQRTGSGSRNWSGITSNLFGSSSFYLAACVYGDYIYTSTNGGVNWTQQLGSGSRNWTSIKSSINGSSWYLTATVDSGDIYISIDNGVTWSSTASGSKKWTSCDVSYDGTTIVGITNNGNVFKSVDTGSTFDRINGSDIDNYSSVSCDASGDNLASTVYNGYIYTSSDGGFSWIQRINSTVKNWNSISVGVDNSTIYMYSTAQNNYIYKSSDSGTNWQRSSPNIPGYFTGEVYEIITMKTYPDINTRYKLQSYLAYKWNINSYIPSSNPFRQNNSSSIFNLMVTKYQDYANINIYNFNDLQNIREYEILSTNSCPPIKKWSGISISSSGKDQTAVADNDYIYVSSDYGNTWNRTSISNAWVSVSISSNGQYQTSVAKFSPIFRSINTGINWTPVGSIKEWTSVAINSDSIDLDNDGKYQFACATDTASGLGDYIYRSTDYGVTWTAVTTTLTRRWSNIEVSGDGIYVTATVQGGKIWRSTDSGVSWTELATTPTTSWSHIDINYNGQYQTATVLGGKIYISSDYGSNWTAVDSDRDWTSVAVNSSGQYQTATVLNGQIYRSTDYGASWTTAASNNKWVHVDMNDSGNVQVAAIEDGYIYVSNNIGEDWNYNSPVDLYHIINPYSTDGGYYIFYLDTSGFYIWKCDVFLQFFNFITSYHFEDPVYQFNCWKLIPYVSKSNNLSFVVTFKNGYAKKFTLSSAGVLTEQATRSFNITQRQGFFSGGDIYKYDDGTTYFFGLVGSKTYNTNIENQQQNGYVYFANITDDTQFYVEPAVATDVTKTFNFASTNSRGSYIYRYPDNNVYLSVRGIGTGKNFFMNITDYTKFVYPYIGLSVLDSGGSISDPPVPWVPVEIPPNPTNSISYEEGLSSSFIPYDMYTNPISNDIYGSLSQNGDYTSYLLPMDDQQFYLCGTNYSNINYYNSKYFPSYGDWTQINLTNNKNWNSCCVSYSGKYQVAVVAGGNIYRSDNFGTTFSRVGPVANWLIISMSQSTNPLLDGKYMLAVSPNNYVYKSDDFGLTWVPIIDVTLGSNRLWFGCAVSETGQYMSVTVNSGLIYMSNDYGVTWTVSNNTPRFWYVVAMSADGQYRIATYGPGFVQVSTDYGVTWTSRGGPGVFFYTSIDATGQYMMASELGGFVYQSDDYGVTWVRQTQVGANFWFGISMSLGDGGKYRTLATSNNTLWRSSDFGVTYTPVEQNRIWKVVSISGDGTYQIANATNDLLYISSDAGVTWQPNGDRWNGVAMSYNYKYVTVLDNGGYIYTSNNYATSFIQRESVGSRKWQKVAINQSASEPSGLDPFAANLVGKYQTATADNDRIYTSSDFGITWTARDSIRAWRGVAMNLDGNIQSAVVAGGQIYTSSDFGVNWTARDSNRAWIDIAMSSDGVKQTAIVYGGRIYRSTDSGVTWSPEESNRNWYSISMSYDGVYQTVTVYGGNIYISSDSGVNWIPVDGTRNWKGVDMDSTGKYQTAVVDGGLVYNSSDYGLTWVGVYQVKNWEDIAVSANGVNKVASVDKDLNYTIFSIRMTQIKHASIGQKTFAVILLTNILNTKAGYLVYYVDISNFDYAAQNYKREDGSFPDPITKIYKDLQGVGTAYINKLDYEGISTWLSYFGASTNQPAGLNTNLSNITIDDSLSNIYAIGGWTGKIQTYYDYFQASPSATGSFTQLNEIKSVGSGYNGFISKLSIIDGKFVWLTPMIGQLDDYLEKIQYINSKNQLAIIDRFTSTTSLLYEKQVSSTGGWSNPLRTLLNLANTSIETSSIVVLDTDSNYKWSTTLYSNEENRKVSLFDIIVDDNSTKPSIEVVGLSNSNQMECIDSTNTNQQSLYSNIDPTTQQMVCIYGFDLDGAYEHSNRFEFSPNMQVNIQDIKSFSNVNQIWTFPNFYTNNPNSYIDVFNRDGSKAKRIEIVSGLSGTDNILNEVGRNCCQPITYLYNSTYVAQNGNTYSKIRMINPSGLPTETDSLVNNNLFIQGSLLSQNPFYSNTTKTLVADNSILNRNYSIRNNFVSSNSITNASEYNIILNQIIDIKQIQRTNLPYKFSGERYGSEWQGSVVKSPIADIITYDTSLLPNSQNRLTITTVYGTQLTTYNSASEVNQPYYLYYPSPTGIKYILVNSVTYNISNQTYFMTISNLNDLKVGGVYYGPYLYLSRKNVSALYTLQFYPATLRFPRTYYVSITNLIIPNRPIRNTGFPGARYLTDLPYIYLYVYNTNDNGEFDRDIVNNFFSNNVNNFFYGSTTNPVPNALFEIPMRYATTPENFIVLSCTTKPKIKFTPGYYNIRFRLADPDGNVLLLDNTPYKPGDSSFTGTTVPDSLMNCNISLLFEPTEFVLTN